MKIVYKENAMRNAKSSLESVESAFSDLSSNAGGLMSPPDFGFAGYVDSLSATYGKLLASASYLAKWCDRVSNNFNNNEKKSSALCDAGSFKMTEKELGNLSVSPEIQLEIIKFEKILGLESSKEIKKQEDFNVSEIEISAIEANSTSPELDKNSFELPKMKTIHASEGKPSANKVNNDFAYDKQIINGNDSFIKKANLNNANLNSNSSINSNADVTKSKIVQNDGDNINVNKIRSTSDVTKVKIDQSGMGSTGTIQSN